MELAHEADLSHSPREDAGRLGLWFFILSETLLFGAFFSSYFLSRVNNSACALGTAAWPQATYGLSLGLATLNTVILITSSYTLVRAYLATAEGDRSAVRKNFLYTIALGVFFLLLKAGEYTLKVRHGLYPGGEALTANPGLGIFVSYYFAMTGLHALHMVAGLIWNVALWKAAGRAELNSAFQKKVEYAGLYWHFVDVVWVFLFPLFYLI